MCVCGVCFIQFWHSINSRYLRGGAGWPPSVAAAIGCPFLEHCWGSGLLPASGRCSPRPYRAAVASEAVVSLL